MKNLILSMIALSAFSVTAFADGAGARPFSINEADGQFTSARNPTAEGLIGRWKMVGIASRSLSDALLSPSFCFNNKGDLQGRVGGPKVGYVPEGFRAPDGELTGIIEFDVGSDFFQSSTLRAVVHQHCGYEEEPRSSLPFLVKSENGAAVFNYGLDAPAECRMIASDKLLCRRMINSQTVGAYIAFIRIKADERE